MDIIDDLLGTDTNNKNNNSNSNNKQYNNNWKEQNKKRNEAYKKMDSMSLKITKDGNCFEQYLNVLSRFERYSVGNCLLILEKEPNAIQIKSKEDWRDKGYDINNGADAITILEPYETKGKKYYNPKEEYDVTQTNAPIPEEKTYTSREILIAILDECKAKREVVDILPNGEKGSQYIEKENKLYMCRGIKQEYLLKTVIQEIARMETQGIEDGVMKEFKTCCTSYMICKKYGLDTSKFDFTNLPKELVNISNGKDIRKELEDIRKNFIKVDDIIKTYFDKQSKEQEKSNKNQEQGR